MANEYQRAEALYRQEQRERLQFIAMIFVVPLAINLVGLLVCLIGWLFYG